MTAFIQLYLFLTFTDCSVQHKASQMVPKTSNILIPNEDISITLEIDIQISVAFIDPI